MEIQKRSLLILLALLSVMTTLTGCSEEAVAGIGIGLLLLYIFGSLILLVLVFLAVIDIFKKPYSLPKKIIWLAVIFFIPFLGAIAYFLLRDRTI